MQLSKLVSELLVEHDCVTVPGLGSFLGNFKSAHYDLENEKFYPPSKQISFNSQIKANDGLLDSNIVTVNITLTCSPCTEKTIEAGSSGVIISYRGCDCRKYDAYVPKGEVYIFCHLDGSVVIGSGSYTVLSSKVCY